MSDAKVKPKPGHGKRSVPDKGGNVLQTRFGTASLFQPRSSSESIKGGKAKNNECVEAFIEQASFDGILFVGKILVPPNANLRSKLSTEWEKGEGRLE